MITWLRHAWREGRGSIDGFLWYAGLTGFSTLIGWAGRVAKSPKVPRPATSLPSLSGPTKAL